MSRQSGVNELIPAEATGTGNDSHGVAATILKLAFVTLGAAGIAGWLALGLVHLGDRYMVGTGAGEWMALARYANEGTLYPPLSNGVRYGGTRYMPLPIVVNAAAARLTGEYLSSGKAVALVLFGVLLTLVFTVLRQLRCPWPLAAAMTGLLPATNTGLGVGSSIGGDALPVVLQLGALMTLAVAVRRNIRAGVFVAGGLAGLAAASKLTGVWAALAIVSWLCLQRDWRRLMRFALCSGITAALALGLVQWASQGRFLTTFMTFTFAGTGGPVGWIRAPNQLVLFGSRDVAAVWILAPFAVMAVFASRPVSALNVYHHALRWSLLLTLVVFTDMGAGSNQLLDPAVLTIVAVGSLAARFPPERLEALSLSTALAVALGWAGITGIRGFVPDLREALAIARSGQPLPKYNPRPLANVMAPGDSLLAEDPTIPVLLGQTPVVLDAFMLRRLDEVQPDAVDGLIARIERGEFDHVALVTPLEEDDFWWQHYNFGLRVAAALRKTYVFVRMVDGYYLYQPGRS